MLIGLYSPAPQSGKSTVAGHLGHMHGAYRLPFAQHLKNMADQLAYLLPFSESDLYEGDKSQVVYQGKTLRHLLQTLGTEWGRKCMGENFWVDLWAKDAAGYLEHGCNVVADDVRFPNEFEAVKKLGGQMWRIVRPGVGEDGTGHSSERGLEGFAFDKTIYNNTDVTALCRSVDAVLADLQA
jgi:hypothetical protein